MTKITSLFATRLYQSTLLEQSPLIDLTELSISCYRIAEDDIAGQEWCEAQGYPGYTSYASLNDLPWRFPIFADLVKLLETHVTTFAAELAFDLGERKLTLDSIWINILPEGGIHTGHIHPHSVISGTIYVVMPKGASTLKFEDPRLPMMMAAPQKAEDAPEDLQQFHYVTPSIGDVLLWEGWLRHEVPMNLAEEERISVSFNFGLG